MEQINSEIGVIIGRFQIHNLHEAHIDLIESVLNKHEKVILFIGTTSAIGTKKNPLDFITRKYMIEEKFGTRISSILPISDQKSDIVWSNQIDKKIREIFNSGSVTLYGSRDSFIYHYKGSFKICELEPDSYISATDIRQKVGKSIIKSEDFRAGIIYSVYNQYPMVHPTVDIVIVRDNGDILLGKKPNEDKWRFIGGFVDPEDKNEIAACKREGLEETGLELGDFEFISSRRIEDWRYSGVKDRSIMTHLYKCKYIYGSPQPNDDICELKWFPITLDTSILVEEHIYLFNDYLNYKKL